MKFIGTAHSCKGLEFDKVIVADDFPTIEDLIVNLYKKGKLVGYIEGNKFIVKKEGLFDVFRNGSNSVREELNLLYVAFTRFKKEVEIPNIYKLKDEYVVELPMEEECIGSFIDEREIDDSLEYLHI
jgi:ATP-dependent exoDNAse (exonuclease V) beta subunit